jgi:hypothetical protein
VQCRVPVEANVPFSKYLFDGEPPPHRPKYSHSALHCAIPSSTSRLIRWNLAELAIDARSSCRTFPITKSP